MIESTALRNARSGPFWLVAPRAMSTFPSGVIDQRAVEGRDVPAGLFRLHVVHHVDDQRSRRAGVVEAQDAGMTRGRDDGDLLEPERAQVGGKKAGHLRDAAVLRADRRLPHPALQVREVWLDVRVDVLVHVVVLARVCGDP